MLYDQGYFYGNMNDYGLKVHNSSVNNNAVFESLQKRKREFDDSLVSEYTDYSDICESFCYIGAIRINQGELNSRYSTLHHIFVPAEKTDINDPYTYIRYFYPYYYNSSKNLNEPLYQADIPKIPLNYNELLSFCMLDGKENRKRFAKLLELMYNVIFMEKTVAVVLPDKFFEIFIDEMSLKKSNPSNIYPILNKMEESGIIDSELKTKNNKKIKYFKITEDGEYVLNYIYSRFDIIHNSDQWKLLFSDMD